MSNIYLSGEQLQPDYLSSSVYQFQQYSKKEIRSAICPQDRQIEREKAAVTCSTRSLI